MTYRIALALAAASALLGTACTERDGARIEQLAVADAPDILVHDSTLFGIMTLRSTPEGRLWILSPYEPFLRLYSHDGLLVRVAARRGSGPQELRNPWTIVASTEEGVTVFDIGGRRLVTFHRDSQPLITPVSTNPGMIRSDIREVVYGRMMDVQAFGLGYLVGDLPRGLGNFGGYQSTVLLRLPGAEGALPDTILNFDTDTLYGAAAASAEDLFGNIPLWTTCDNNVLAVWDAKRSALTWFDIDLSVTERRELKLPARQISDDELAAYVRAAMRREMRTANVEAPDEELERLVRNMLPRARALAPPTAPAFVNILCAADGTVWLQHFDTRNDVLGRGSEWMIVGREPIPLKRAVLPLGFEPHLVESDRLLGVWRDNQDVQWAAALRLPE